MKTLKRQSFIIILSVLMLAALSVPSALMPGSEAFQGNSNRPVNPVARPGATPLPRATPIQTSGAEIQRRTPAPLSECFAPGPAKHNVCKTVDLQAPQVKLDPLL